MVTRKEFEQEVRAYPYITMKMLRDMGWKVISPENVYTSIYMS